MIRQPTFGEAFVLGGSKAHIVMGLPFALVSYIKDFTPGVVLGIIAFITGVVLFHLQSKILNQPSKESQ